MNHITLKIVSAFICIIFLQICPALAQDGHGKSEWTGKLSDGTVITERDLKKILKAHQRLHEIDKNWREALENGSTEVLDHLRNEAESIFQPANLAGADLSRVDLSGVSLEGANLSAANLTEANLSGANLSGVDLSDANLTRANLRGSHLSYGYIVGFSFGSATLSGADLSAADLSEADLVMVNLSGAKMTGAMMNKTKLSWSYLAGSNFRNADLSDADLSYANMSETDLRDANLKGADLSGAQLHQAKLFFAKIEGADLSGAQLRQAKLVSANLEEANLSGANLIYADLRLASLRNADFRSAFLIGTDFTNAELYNTKFMGGDSPELNLTRKMVSHRDSKRLNACYAMLDEWESLATEGGLYNNIKSLYNLIFLDLTGQYGLKPARPLIILICLIPYFAFFYVFALLRKSRKTGIWLILSKEHTSKLVIKERPFKLTSKFPPRHLPTTIINKISFKISCWYRMIRIGLYFSLLSAFNVGWREINTKSLITRLQRRDYTLRATGWARSLSGIQSLISIFLLVLWAFTTFGLLY